MTTHTFSLRFRDEQLRELVQEIAARQGMSQNEYIEGVIRNDVVVRGELLASELAETAARLGSMTNAQREELIEQSLERAAQGEANPDPLAMHQIDASWLDNDAGLGAEDWHGIAAAFQRSGEE